MRVFKNRRVKAVLAAFFLIAAAECGVLAGLAKSMETAIEDASGYALFRNSVRLTVSAMQYLRQQYITAMIVTVCIALLLAAGVFLAVEYLHSKKINAFQQKIDRILHGKREMGFGTPREGDFESLESSICKMVDALYTQQDALQDEKIVLVNALENISHQMKTPLSMIRMTADLVAADPDMDPLERKLRLERIQEHIDRLSGFVKLLLDASRLDADVEKMKAEDFAALDVIRMAVMQLTEMIDDREISLHVDAAPDVMLHGDQYWFSEALANIIKNCIEHSEVGGSIFITVRKDAVKVLIEIRDTGSGIDPEDLPYILERFHRGKDARSGSAGIGLSLAQQVIHRMGGSLTPDNYEENGEICGAIFSIRMEEVIV